MTHPTNPNDEHGESCDGCRELRYVRRIEELTAERDALAAVIDPAKATLRDTGMGFHERRDRADAILAAADTDAALREVRAKVVEDFAAKWKYGDGGNTFLSGAAERYATAIRAGQA